MIDMRDYCEECGVELPLDGHSPRRKFCSRRCHNLNYRAVERAAKFEERRNRPPCKGCGSKMEPTARDSTIFCTVKCQEKWRGKERVRKRNEARIEARRDRSPCQCCGGAIPVTLRKGTVFCKRSCGAKSRKSRKRLTRAALPTHFRK